VFWLLLVGIVAAYLTLVELVKRRFERGGNGRSGQAIISTGSSPTR
jgi:hypothetical protein